MNMDIVHPHNKLFVEIRDLWKVRAVASTLRSDATKGLRVCPLSQQITYLELSHWRALRNTVHGNSTYFDNATLLTFQHYIINER